MTATPRPPSSSKGWRRNTASWLRVRMPGGRLTAAQYLALDALADRYGNATLRVTTRQTIQFHGILKGNLKPAIAAINDTLLTTQGACGDVVRNVTTSPAPRRDAAARPAAGRRPAALGRAAAAHPRLSRDLPRRGAGARPPARRRSRCTAPPTCRGNSRSAWPCREDNTIDVLSNDLGLIAIWEGGALRGYNVAVGGGMGMTHNRPDTYPRLASLVGSVGPDELLRPGRGGGPGAARPWRARRPQAGAAEIPGRRQGPALDARGDRPRTRPPARRPAAHAARSRCPSCSAGTSRATAPGGSACRCPPGASPMPATVRLRTALREAGAALRHRPGADAAAGRAADQHRRRGYRGAVTRLLRAPRRDAGRATSPRWRAGRWPARRCRPAAWR